MHAHPGALAILAAQVLPSPDKVRQRFTATHVSTWLMASGHVLRTQKELFPEITVGGGTYGLISQQTTGVIYTAIIWPQRTSPFGPAVATRQKNPNDSRELRRARLKFEIWLQPLDRQNR